jgi:hypothetical protein
MCAAQESFRHWIAARQRATIGFSGELILLSVRFGSTAGTRQRLL